VRTSEIKLQLNNAAGGLLYFMRPHIPETEIKQKCRRSAATKPRPSAVVLFQFYFTVCNGLQATCVVKDDGHNCDQQDEMSSRREAGNL